MLQIHFKRAKCFVANVNGGTRKFIVQPTSSTQACPNWIKHTSTFEHGIKDGSIIDLTPPTPAAAPAPPAPDPEIQFTPAPVGVSISTPEIGSVENIELDPAEDDQSEDQVKAQEDVPDAPFGGQPMTPVPPAPKVGGIRASGVIKKGK